MALHFADDPVEHLALPLAAELAVERFTFHLLAVDVDVLHLRAYAGRDCAKNHTVAGEQRRLPSEMQTRDRGAP
jgi:hypothetical protein